MRRIHKFLKLSSAEKRLLIRVWILIGTIRLGLELLSFSTLKKIFIYIKSLLAFSIDEFSEEQLTWAITVASRYIPRATCLAQALALRLLLQQSGHQACLHIGVTDSEEERLKAHAWVKSRGRILIGGSELNRYTHLLVLE
jgi:hypothetical protein